MSVNSRRAARAGIKGDTTSSTPKKTPVNMKDLQDYYIATFTNKTPSPAAKAAYRAASSDQKKVARTTGLDHVNNTKKPKSGVMPVTAKTPKKPKTAAQKNADASGEVTKDTPAKRKGLLGMGGYGARPPQESKIKKKLDSRTNPKKQSSDSNAEKDEIKNKGKGRGKVTNPFNKRGGTVGGLERLAKSTEAAKNRPGSNKGIGKKAEAKPTPPKPTKRPKKMSREVMDTADYGNYAAGSKTPPKPTPRPKKRSGQNISKTEKGFGSGPGTRKYTSGSTDARNNVITRTLGKLFNDKRSQAEKTKTRKDNQAFWDDNGPDK